MRNKNLKDYRMKLGLTQLQVAKNVGISERAYQNYETGARIPNVKVAMQIAESLKCEVRDIFSIPHEQTGVK